MSAVAVPAGAIGPGGVPIPGLPGQLYPVLPQGISPLPQLGGGGGSRERSTVNSGQSLTKLQTPVPSADAEAADAASDEGAESQAPASTKSAKAKASTKKGKTKPGPKTTTPGGASAEEGAAGDAEPVAADEAGEKGSSAEEVLGSRQETSLEKLEKLKTTSAASKAQRFLKGRGGKTEGGGAGKEAVPTKDGGDEEGIKSES